MDAVAGTAHSLRQAIAAQSWLEWVQPSIANAPDWALAATALAFIALLLVLVFLMVRRGAGKRLHKQSHATKSAPVARASPTSPMPPPVAPAAASKPKPAAAAPEPQKRAKAELTPAPPPATDDEDNRSLRVFVSSTFLDMQAERDELVTKAFPALRAKYRARGVEVFEVDLRWGITREQQERGETLPTLLAEIDRCRPYFIGLIGDRYGWVPPASALTEKLKTDYPAIANAEGASVTAMEIMHGVLSNPNTAGRAFFFERNADWDWIATLAEADRAAASAEPATAVTKLDDLRVAIRETAARVETYARPEDIRQKVIDALNALLEARFPEAEAPDAFEQTARLHRAYARERRGLHVGAASYTRALDQWMATAAAPPILITGASGGGKSTLVANWLHDWRAAHPESRALVFEHYLGASPDSAEPILIMRRLWGHLNRATDETVDPPYANADLMDVAAGLAQRLAQARATADRSGARILIALDGLDKLSSEQNLRWLLTVPGVRVLASSLDGEAKTAALARGFTPLEVKPLTETQRQEFIEGTLARWRRQLEPQHVAGILKPAAEELAGSPLYLKTVLDELRVSADDARLAERLDDYCGARDMTDLFDRVLARLEYDCEQGFVANALPLVWASRAGLEEAEIIALTGATPLAWATLRNGLGDSLRDRAGRMEFGHDYLNQAVATRYLKSEEAKRAAHIAIADRFEKSDPDARQVEELPYQLRASEAWGRLSALLTDLNRFELLLARGDGELLSYWLPLKARGHDPEVLLCGAIEARAGEAARWTTADIDLAFDIGRFLHFAGEIGTACERLHEGLAAACKRLLGSDHPTTLASNANLAKVVLHRGNLSRAQDLLEAILDGHVGAIGQEHSDSLVTNSGSLATMSVLAETVRASGDFAGAEKLFYQVFEIRNRLLGAEHADTIISLGNMALCFFDRGDFAGARRVEEAVLEGNTRKLGAEHRETLTSASNLASTLRASGDHAGARRLQQSVIDTQIRVLGVEHPDTLRTMNNLGETLRVSGDLTGAAQCMSRVMEGQQRLRGAEHPLTLKSMNNLAVILGAQGDLTRARQMQERTLEIQMRVYPQDHSDTIETMNNLAVTLSTCGDLAAAEKLLQNVLDATTRQRGAEHPSTITGLGNLAATVFRRGNVVRAQELMGRAVELSVRIHGEAHATTKTFEQNLSLMRGRR